MIKILAIEAKIDYIFLPNTEQRRKAGLYSQLVEVRRQDWSEDSRLFTNRSRTTLKVPACLLMCYIFTVLGSTLAWSYVRSVCHVESWLYRFGWYTSAIRSISCCFSNH